MQPRDFPDHEAISQAAARWLEAALRYKPSALFCLATGSTPTRAYDLFVERTLRRGVPMHRMRVLKLDEWGGLAMNDPASCERHLQRHIVRPLALGKRYVGFRSNPPVPAKECARIERWLAEHGPIDVCVLGLGINGHVAFNEPGRFLRSGPHVASLARASLRHAMLKESRSQPRFGLTLGMADLLQSQRILLLVSGGAKRQAFHRLMSGEITPAFPASFLWLHPNTTVFHDLEPSD